MGLEKIEEYKRRLGMTTAAYCPVSQKTQNLKP